MAYMITDTHATIETTTISTMPELYSTLDLTLGNDSELYYNRHDLTYVYKRVTELVELHHSDECLTPAYVTATLLETLNEWKDN